MVGAVLAAGTLTACTSGDAVACDASDPKHLGIVYGATANSAAPALTESGTGLLEQAAESNGSVTIVVPSGVPEAAPVVPLGSPAHDEAICADDHARAVSAVSADLEKRRASTPEVDYLAAMDLAARSGGGSQLGVLVVGSGLQTTGTLNFVEGDLLYAPAAEVADALRTANELPSHLAGVTVYWSGMGDVSSPQQPLSISARENLIAIWRAVIEGAGGTLEVLEEPLTGAPDPGLPDVTAVPIRAVPLTPSWDEPVVLHDDQVRFQPDSSELLDEASVRIVLGEIATSIADGSVAVTVTGSTSAQGSQSQEADVQLSLARAERVKGILVSLGAPADSIQTAGVGHEWCGFIDEVDGGGKTAEQRAAENRKVILTAAGMNPCA
ncbi:OmpA family protein [Naasia sp. SYSU D00057]|uniref:OmpA family protein n=1 Tax=Naasia sp. SYSU D00057 TaxID=2817380 RepID=UPI001B31786F|nr:OmpA family protein [Naasia sp. SYSU D00057]